MIKIAFIKFGGMAIGGTEKVLQTIAAELPKDQFQVDYFYCDAAPYIGSDYKHIDTDPSRVEYCKENGINLIKFNVGFKDVTKSTSEEPSYKNLQFNAAVDDGVNGRISIYLAPTATKLLEEGKYVYNVVAKNPSDDVIEVLSGLAFVNNAFANFNPLVPTPRN